MPSTETSLLHGVASKKCPRPEPQIDFGFGLLLTEERTLPLRKWEFFNFQIREGVGTRTESMASLTEMLGPVPQRPRLCSILDEALEEVVNSVRHAEGMSNLGIHLDYPILQLSVLGHAGQGLELFFRCRNSKTLGVQLLAKR